MRWALRSRMPMASASSQRRMSGCWATQARAWPWFESSDQARPSPPSVVIKGFRAAPVVTGNGRGSILRPQGTPAVATG
jgi:hypothetical protein